MSQNTQRDHVSKARVLYTMPGVEAVRVRRDEAYRATDAGPLTLDLYYPHDAKAGSRTAAVVFVTGFSDAGAERIFGCKLKDMGLYTSWAHLAAASGMVAVTYVNQEPAADVHAVLEHVRRHAAALGIDESRIGVWACSGNAPVALSLLRQDAPAPVKCAVLCYPYTLDLDGATGVAEAARQFGFANPTAGTSVDDLARDVPLFVVKAGQDRMPGLNDALDRFIARAVAVNLPLSFVNHAAAPHAFDLFDDTATTRQTVRRVLEFLHDQLLT